MTALLFLALGLLVGYFIRMQYELPRVVWAACQNDWPKEYFTTQKAAAKRCKRWQSLAAEQAAQPGYRVRVHYSIQMLRKG